MSNTSSSSSLISNSSSDSSKNTSNIITTSSIVSQQQQTQQTQQPAAVSAQKSPIVEELQRSLAELKSYSLVKQIRIGTYVDVYDSNQNKWCVGKVVSIEGKGSLEIRFDGWSDRYKEIISIGKVDSFRKWTDPYTGGQKSSRDDYTIGIMREEANQEIEEMSLTDQSDFTNISDPLSFTQHYRGKLFVLGDIILTIAKALPERDVSIYIDFFYSYIRMFNKYLQILPKLLPIFIEASTSNKSAYLVNTKVAIASAFPEFFSLLSAIFGGELNKFDSVNNSSAIAPSKEPVFSTSHLQKQNNEEKNDGPIKQILTFMNYFATFDGIDKLLNLLSWEEKVQSEVYLVPLSLLSCILNLFYNCLGWMQQEKKQEYALLIKKKCVERITRITDKEIKDIHVGLVQEIIQTLTRMLVRSCESNNAAAFYEEMEKLEVSFLIKLIRSNNLEKKIQGITVLKEIFNRASEEDKDHKYIFSSSNNQQDRNKFEYFTREKLLHFLTVEMKLLDVILCENFHSEIFKRSMEVLQFFSQENALEDKHIEMIWGLTENKHETDLAAIYSLITQLASVLNAPTLNRLYGFINRIPFENFTDLTVNLLKEFTINATEATWDSRKIGGLKSKVVESQEAYGVGRLFAAIQESSNINSAALLGKCIDALSEIFKIHHFIQYRNSIIEKCFQNLKSGVSVCSSLKLLCTIQKHSQIANVFADAKGQLLDDVISDFGDYLKAVGAKVKKAAVDVKKDEVLVGQYSHSENIELRLKFMALLNKQMNKMRIGGITVNHLKSLWKILVCAPVTPIEKNIFLAWLTLKRKSDNHHQSGSSAASASSQASSSMQPLTLDDSIQAQILEEIFINSELMNNFIVDRDTFECVKSMFLSVNTKNNSIEISQQQQLILVSKFENILGKDILWNMSFAGQTDQSILDSLTTLLVGIHARKLQRSLDSKLRNWQHLQSKCITQLKSTKNVIVQTHLIIMIKTFLEEIEGKMKIGEKMSDYTICVNHSTSGKRNIKVPCNSTLLRLRKEIVQEFKLGKRDFTMLFVNNNLTISKDQEEDYTVEALSTNDGNLPGIAITNIKEASQDILDLDQFKAQLCNSQLSSILLNFLSNHASQSIVENAWSILTLLPKNPTLLTRLSNPRELKAEGWGEILPTDCFSKLQYSFQAITAEFLPQRQDELSKEQAQWCQAFVSADGLKHLLKLFMLFQSDADFASPFNFYTISTLAEIIAIFLKYQYASHTKEFTVSLSAIVQKSLFYVNTGIERVNGFMQAVKGKSGSGTTAEGNNSKFLVQKYMNVYIKNSFDLIKQCFLLDPTLIPEYLHVREKISASLTCSPHFKPILLGLLSLEDAPPRNQIQISLAGLIEQDTSGKAQLVLENTYTVLIQSEKEKMFEQYRATSYEFFLLYKKTLTKIQQKVESVTSWNSFQATLKILLGIIKSAKPFEKDKMESDGLLRGVLSAAQLLMSLHESLGEIVIADPDIAKHVIQDCLFSIATEEQPMLPKCKNLQTRLSAFGFLVSLQQIVHKGGACTPKQLSEIMKINELIVRECCNSYSHWRTRAKGDWNIKEEQEKEQSCPLGLVNLGCTCYMNSLLQQLFTINEFSSSICKVDATTSEKEFNSAENVLHQLQLVFSALDQSKRQYYNPRGFCNSIKNEFGEPMNVMQQMDVDEFFNTLLDRLENLLKPSKNEFIVKNIFEGKLANELIGMGDGCTHTSEREEPFNSVCLTVQNKSSVAESLASFVQGEMLDGDNSYFCEKCNKKVPTLKRQSLKKLPNQLIVVLKRFQFDLDTMQKLKVNTYCEFPHNLNLQQYTQEYLHKKQESESASKNEKESSSSSKISGDSTKGEAADTSSVDKQLPEEYYNYRLRGVVIHQGTSESGHYYSLIRQKGGDEKWMEYNDQTISEFDINDLPAEAFGGDHQNLIELQQQAGGYLMNSKAQQKILENNKNAYLLFYERDQYFDAEGNQIETLLDQSSIVNPTSVSREHIEDEMKKLHWNKYMFSSDLIDYATKLLSVVDTNNSTSELTFETAKFLIGYFFTVVVRVADKSCLPVYRKFLGTIIGNNAAIAKWVVANVADESFLKEIFNDSPHDDIKYLCAGVICDAIMKHIESESALTYDTFLESSPLVQLLQVSLRIVSTSRIIEFKLLDQLHRILSFTAQVSKHARQFLVQEKTLTMLSTILSDGVHLYNDKSRKNPSLFACNDSLLPPKQLSQATSIDEYLEIKEKAKRVSAIRKNPANLLQLYSTLLRSVAPLVSSDRSEVSAPFLTNRINIASNPEENYKFVNGFQLIWPFCNRRLARKHLALSLATLTIENTNYFEIILINFAKQLKKDTKIDENDLKVFFLFLKYALQIKDSLFVKRVTDIVPTVGTFFVNNSKFFYAASIAFDSIINISSVSRGFKSEMMKLIQSNKELRPSLDQFMQQSGALSNSIGSRYMTLFRDRQVQVNMQRIQKLSETIKSKAIERRQKIDGVLQKNLELVPAPEYDSDEDIPAERKLVVKDKVFLLHDDELQPHVVVETITDMIKVQSVDDKNSSKWIKYDDDILREFPNAAKSYPNPLTHLHV